MEKNNYKWIIAILVILAIIGGIYFYSKNKPNNQTSNYEANKTSTEENKEENKNKDDDNKEENNKEYIEEKISTFSTKIYNSDPARQNNIKLTCSTLDSTIVANGETFSFCNTIGQSTSDKGYQEADIFDNKGHKKKGLGRWKLPNK